MKQKLAIIGYVPPKGYGTGEFFLRHIERFVPKNELVLFSDTQTDKLISINLKASVEDVKGVNAMSGQYEGRPNPFAVNNRCFFTALRIAIKKEFSHILLVEDDVRVSCAGWDEPIFEAFFSNPKPILMSGSIVVYNPSNSGMAGLKRWTELIKSNTRKNLPIPTYGFKGQADGTGSAVFPNGAGAVFSVDALKMLFPEIEQPGISYDLALNGPAWDFFVGLRLWEKFGPDAYDLVGMNECIFSSFGNVITTEAERLKMLHEGLMLVHQCKSEVE